MQDIQGCVDMIVNATLSSTNLVASWAELGLENVLGSFDAHIVAPQAAAHPGKKLSQLFPHGVSAPDLSAWFESGCHPRHIEENVIERTLVLPLRHYRSENQTRLREWYMLLVQTVNTDEYAAWALAGLPFLDRFRSTVAQLGLVLRA
jgi:hypothetical protein